MPNQPTKVTILEFCPAADEIWTLKKDKKDGYKEYDRASEIVSIATTGRGAKVRPTLVATYAGGKATNVARVFAKLLSQKKDGGSCDLTLITFMPNKPGGRYIYELQKQDFDIDQQTRESSSDCTVKVSRTFNSNRIELLWVKIDDLARQSASNRSETVICTDRRCINCTSSLDEDSGMELNFSPRVLWSRNVLEQAEAWISDLQQPADLVVLAGTPPKPWVKDDEDQFLNFYARVIAKLKQKNTHVQISLDVAGEPLKKCIDNQKKPDIVCVNTEEFSSATGGSSNVWNGFNGILTVHDKKGAKVWDRTSLDRNLSHANPIPSVDVSEVLATIGAGDAFHAGFLFSREILGEQRLCHAAGYGLATAAAAVEDKEGTRGKFTQQVQKKLKSAQNKLTAGQ